MPVRLIIYNSDNKPASSTTGIAFVMLLFLSSATYTLVEARENQLTLVSEEEFFDPIAPVESVTRLPQLRSETPAAVSIIDSEVIRASGARDLADVFRLIPGFQVAYQRGHRPTVTYHGLGDEFSRRMQILIDGRSVYSALFGHVSWSSQAIAIEDIDRIEVVRGPNTVSYGANAFLGTINIITRKPVQDRGSYVKLSAGNHDIRDAVLRYGSGFAQGDLRITAGYNSDDGLKNLPDDNQTGYLNLRSDLQLSATDSLLVQAGISEANPQEGFYDIAEFPPTTSKVRAHFAQLRWQRHISNNNEFSLQFYNNYRDVDYSYLTDPLSLGPPFGDIQIPVSFNDTTERYDLEFQHSFKPAQDWALVWGAGIREDRVKSPDFFFTEEHVTNVSSRVFANTAWHMTNRSILNAGAMLEDSDITGTDLSPRIALNHHLNSEHTLRAIWSKAKRNPSLFEEKADLRFYYQDFLLQHQFAAMGGLRPETMTSFELGYLGHIADANLTVDIRLYQDKISDFISEVRVAASDLVDGEAFSYRNEGEINVTGLDMEIVYRPSIENRILLSLAIMNATASEVDSSVVEDQQERIDSVPDYSGSLLAMHRFNQNWSGSIGYYFVDNITWLSDGGNIPSYQRVDVRLARRFIFTRVSGEVALVAQNIGNEYEDFNNNQYFDDRAFLSLSMSW